MVIICNNAALEELVDYQPGVLDAGFRAMYERAGIQFQGDRQDCFAFDCIFGRDGYDVCVLRSIYYEPGGDLIGYYPGEEERIDYYPNQIGGLFGNYPVAG
ncbi:MAG: hypothetical protein EZS28_055349 [Streblomastix strix]|uniref:Uncharacterized protein n=1 Tax=Streblomastix strix TaxID=222440 RepID=A0A5J4Q507_9EUKA|nr:MAG: hypothetical protein EZS28_055349 [Streblomastix strix]